MARVLMERNQYKERFMELQEAVRYDTYFTDEGQCHKIGFLKKEKKLWHCVQIHFTVIAMEWKVGIVSDRHEL